MGELKKCREQVEAAKREKDELEKEINNSKSTLLEEKKLSSRLQAELNDTKATLAKT